MAFGARSYTLDQVLAAIALLQPGFGEGTTLEHDIDRAPIVVQQAVRFLDAVWDARLALKLPNHLQPAYGSPGPDWMRNAAAMEDRHESVRAGVPASPPVPDGTAIDEREFIRQAVAILEMVSFEDLPANRIGIRFEHGGFHATYVLSKQSRTNADGDPDALPRAFIALAEGCVRDGRKILEAHDAQKGTP